MGILEQNAVQCCNAFKSFYKLSTMGGEMGDEKFAIVLYLLLNKNVNRKSQKTKICEEEDSRLAFH